MSKSAAVETVRLGHGLLALLLDREQAGPPTPRPDYDDGHHRQSRRGRRWGDDPMSTTLARARR